MLLAIVIYWVTSRIAENDLLMNKCKLDFLLQRRIMNHIFYSLLPVWFPIPITKTIVGISTLAQQIIWHFPVICSPFDPSPCVYLGDNSSLEIKGSGQVEILLSDGTLHILENVLHIPDLRKNLFCIKQLDSEGGSAVIQNGQCILRDSDNQILTTCYLVNLYKLGETATPPSKSSSIIAATAVFPNVADLWHHLWATSVLIFPALSP